MRLLADVHISPRTVEFLHSLGYDVVRVSDVLSATASDSTIVTKAIEEGRTILTQDLDFSALVALAGKNVPSLITLRLSSSRIEHVNSILQRILPGLENAVSAGAIVTVEDSRVRRRNLPLS